MTESEIMKRTGVPRKVLATVRSQQLHEGADFKKEGRAVDVSKTGVAALERAGIDVNSRVMVSSGGNKKAALAAVLRTFRDNPRLLEVILKKTGEAVRVRVRDSRVFVRDQEIPIVEEAGSKMWLLACRQPVIRGRLKFDRGILE